MKGVRTLMGKTIVARHGYVARLPAGHVRGASGNPGIGDYLHGKCSRERV